MKRGIRSRGRLARLSAAGILAAALAAIAATPALAHDRGRDGDGHGNRFDRGAIYTETNNATANAVLVFARRSDGTIVQQASVPTDGVGLSQNPPFGFPIVDSQGAVITSEDGELLFAVNAGDNTITVFRVTRHGLTKVDRVSSGGIQPISLTSNGNLVYVLNEHSGN